MDRRLIKLRLFWAAGQLVEDVAKLLLRCGTWLNKVGNKLADWAERR